MASGTLLAGVTTGRYPAVMPNAPKTPTRVVRIPTELWDAAGDAAARAGTDRSAVIRELLAWYARQPGSKLPKRPEPGE